MDDRGASANADPALAVPVEPASGLAPSGFDPSREWNEWAGGVCPVSTDTLIMTRHRSGWESQGPALAGYHRWDHGRTPDSPLRSNDIVAYRVVLA